MKIPTDDKLRKQINNSKIMSFVFYFGSFILIYIGIITKEIVSYVIAIILMILFSVDYISARQDKIRLEIRELKSHKK